MESFVSRYKNVLVLIVVLVAQLLALAVQAKRTASEARDGIEVSLMRSLVVSVVTPPERLLHNIGSGIRGLWAGYVNLIHVREDNAGLKAEVERLRLEQASLAEDAKQGQRLQRLLDFKQHYVYQTVPAQVIGTSGTDQSRILYIDKGLKDGFTPDMPVMTADGIVGKLKDVFDHTSQVLLISDPTSGVGVILETTRTRGILKGTSLGQPQVINVSPDERIKAGERIITSGGDQIFPRGMPVGTVDQVMVDPDRDPLVDVTIHPAANLSRLEEVLVVTNVGETASSQEMKDLAASEAEGVAAQKRASDVLSERLPARLDPKAPSDTNPDPQSSGENVRLMPPPKPLHADQYTPNATPPSTEMVPGQRRAPVLSGSEDTERPPATPKPSTAAATTTANAKTGEPGTTAVTKKSLSVPGTVAGSANGFTGLATVPRTATSAPRIPTPSTGTPSSASASSPVRSRATTGAGTGSAAAGSGTAGVAERGSGTTPTARTPVRTDATTPAATDSANSDAPKPAPKTHVIVDGPARTPARPASDQPAKKKGPELVPDDGSKPPPARKPAPATPPNGGR
jgi:rod shape-determining protein MreC